MNWIKIACRDPFFKEIKSNIPILVCGNIKYSCQFFPIFNCEIARYFNFVSTITHNFFNYQLNQSSQYSVTLFPIKPPIPSNSTQANPFLKLIRESYLQEVISL